LHYRLLYTDDALGEVFKLIGGSLDNGPDNIQMYMCYRHEHVPVLHIRDAR